MLPSSVPSQLSPVTRNLPERLPGSPPISGTIKKVDTKGIPQIKSLKYVKGKGVKITWTKSDYADKYFIFRSDDGFFKEVKASKSYTYDKTVKKGKKYTYEVKAFNEEAMNGKASDEVTIKVPKK